MTFKTQSSLFALVGLIAVWSMFYAGVKYFFWGFYSSSFSPSLEEISGFILLGSMIAYIVGGYLYRSYGEMKVLMGSTYLGFFCFIGTLFLPQFSSILFYIMCSGMGFSYSLYVIGKNIVIGREMTENKKNTSLIGAITTVVFIIFMIAGTIIGAKTGESASSLLVGGSIFILLMICAYIFTPKVKIVIDQSYNAISFKSYKKVCQKYLLYILGLACFWEVSVEVSQMAIRFSKDFFGSSNTEASLLLIFSSFGAIIGNILSVRFGAKKIVAFLAFTLPLLIIIASFGWILELSKGLDVYVFIEITAGIIGFLFGGAVNLAESHFLSLIGEDPDKEYVSSLYGFSIAALGASIMFLSEKMLESGAYISTSLFLGIFMSFSAIVCFRGLRKK